MTRFGEHRRAVISNNSNQPVARHFNSGNHSVSDMEIRVLCPISGSKDSHISYVSLYLSLPDFNSHLIDPYLF